jgi:sporulation protein YlmC with PRC-barrel domain
MNPFRKRPDVAVCVALVLALPGVAAGADRPPANHDANTAAASVTTSRATGVRLSKLIGTNVHDAQGHAVGEIKDVVFDANTGRIHYAVLAAGGVLGVGDKMFALPLSKLHRAAKGKLVVDVTREQLSASPRFDHAPDWNDNAYRATVDRAYGLPSAQRNARFRRASDVMNVNVRDNHGADVGSVKEIVVDLPAKRVDYIVVAFDRAWNTNDKLVAIPIGQLSDGATFEWKGPDAHLAAPPRNPPPTLALGSSEATKGTASAVNPPGSVETRPPAVDPAPGAGVRPIEKAPLKTTTSYADDETLVYKGARESLVTAPAFDPRRYPD